MPWLLLAALSCPDGQNNEPLADTDMVKADSTA